MQRRELFSSLASSLNRAKKQEKLLRPPYFGDESLFHNECSKCDAKCATVCEEDIIKIANDSTPYLDFTKSGCTYCDRCAIACEFGVLKVEDKKLVNADIIIDKSRCLSWSHTMCFSCKDPCLDYAIDFKAMFMPSINDKCTSCGFCISRCPVDAINIKVTQ
ncbi:MAG: ferredoxin [Sulfurimonas sp. RIFOXYD12_FULL_33_39]|uniref:ferredoxin-type protein NapF n=1 Tax=unclassified Sulfurimonas TaxID=2623549 RepID=UPI0008D40181|nr:MULTISPECIES: ferredoxin-type protein NapF [unclassified Sulfurimonas]OHE07474.1 MAG: ferredoxin [Sulfurimonas sp. RIFCSPLOWO2_12_FULL_34_6]OHE10232.1 MAG: ferredoxin [Sulfurimonas sp. RIFOXYD12_FULL_33_39]OHE14547.1 MAG: ferredoxin [Sulfurimonas sp. RIFOXYD2_FULL_34_21]